MSPSKIYEDQQQQQQVKIKINGGIRPAPLKINKESRFIQKTSSSSQCSSSSNSSNSFTGIAAAASSTKQQQQQQQRHPVIIYTHSPKIIHTNVRDFMSLVQKLTGLQHSDHDDSTHSAAAHVSSSQGNNNTKVNVNAGGNEDTMSSSVITDENSNGGLTDIQVNSSSVSPPFDPNNSYLSDIPIFTPNSSEFFSSSRPFYRYPDSVFAPTNMTSSISPSVLEMFKGFPDYYN